MDNSAKITSIIKNISPLKNVDNLEDVVLFAADDSVMTLCSAEFFETSKNVLQKIKHNNVPGDIVLVGIWRGGSSIYIKHLADELELNKKIFLVDTYEGFNVAPSEIWAKDRKSYDFFIEKFPATRMPGIEDIKNNFKSLNVSLNNVVFINSSDFDIIKNHPDGISFIHIDVDMYEPTSYYLNHIYSKLSKGAAVIVDDYGSKFFNCKDAVDDFLKTAPHHNLVIGEHIASWEV